jgi:hypothetical protein
VSPEWIDRHRVGPADHVQHDLLIRRVVRVAMAHPAAGADVDLDVAAQQTAIAQRQDRATEIRPGPTPAATRKDHPQVAAAAVDQPLASVAPLLPGVG